nr:hypothetical protein [Tanacetum cinerariifolium]
MQNQLTNLTELLTKFVNTNNASTSSSGTLPRNTIANPRSDLKAITTRREATKDTVTPPNNGSTEEVQPLVVQTKTPKIQISKPVSETVIASVNLQRYEFQISFADALILMPKFVSILKALIKNKEKLSEMARTPLNEHCSTVLLKKLPKKLGDPGKFLIPYFDADPRVPLILERSFLKTRRVLIDVFEALEDDPTSPEVDQSYVDTEGDILLLEAFMNDDTSLPLPNQGNYMPQVRKELKNYEAKTDKSSIDEPPKVELKDLPPHLEYVFLDGDDKLPVIIAKDLSIEEKTALITVL